MATARFSQVVARSGTPRVHLTWTSPTRDRALHSAVEHCRLLTLQQNARGQKKDFGLVGLHPGRNVQFLVFPKSLRPFAGKRIVGIDYAAIAEDAVVPASAELPIPKTKPRHPPAKKGAAARADILEFTPPPPEPPRKQKRAATPAPPWLAAVRQAAADLKRGRTVAAYDRLQRLLADNAPA